MGAKGILSVRGENGESANSTAEATPHSRDSRIGLNARYRDSIAAKNPLGFRAATRCIAGQSRYKIGDARGAL